MHDLSQQHRNRPTILARCRIRDREIREVAFVPGWIGAENQPKYVKPAALPGVVKHVEQVSSRFGSQFEVRDEEVVVRTSSLEIYPCERQYPSQLFLYRECKKFNESFDNTS